jgi:hypothetical protein
MEAAISYNEQCLRKPVKQAVQIVSEWVFSPGLCNGKPIPVVADLVVHFPPQ